MQKMARREKSRFCMVLPTCAFFARNVYSLFSYSVIWGVVQLSSSFYRAFCGSAIFFVPLISGIVPEIQFSHITWFLSIIYCFAFLLCTFFSWNVFFFVTFVTFFAGKKNVYQTFCDMVFLGLDVLSMRWFVLIMVWSSLSQTMWVQTMTHIMLAVMRAFLSGHAKPIVLILLLAFVASRMMQNDCFCFVSLARFCNFWIL